MPDIKEIKGELREIIPDVRLLRAMIAIVRGESELPGSGFALRKLEELDLIAQSGQSYHLTAKGQQVGTIVGKALHTGMYSE